MKFKKHYDLVGQHAYLSPSQYAWLSHDAEKLKTIYRNRKSVEEGTELHELAANAIQKKIKLKGNTQTLPMYVNDCIGHRMKPEVPLYYTENCFGTADAIKFDEDNNKLYIFDLKTGVKPAKFDQLMVYAALFCLEYGYNPLDLVFELRIYQSCEKHIFEPTGEEIMDILNRIIEADRVIDEVKKEYE